MSDKNHKQKGIALLLTIILSSLVLVTAAAFTKEMLDEVRNSTRIDNSMVAYYAAEAGLERALLEWRNGGYRAELSDQELNDSTGDVVPALNQNSDPACFELNTDQRVDTNTCTTGAGRDFRTPYFGVTMWYKTNEVRDQRVNKDEVYEFEIPRMNGNVNLVWDYDGQSLPNNTGFRNEITGYSPDGTPISAADGGKFFTCSTETNKTLQQSLLGTPTKIFRIKPWFVNEVFDCANEPTSGITLPASSPVPYINLDILPEGGTLIGLPVTQIESIGYYGGVARKITAQLDRTNGNIVGIFDYVIYSESPLTK